jgi:hypothetical protein
MALPVQTLPVVGTSNATFDAATLACISELQTIIAALGTVNLGTDLNYTDFIQDPWQTVTLGGGVTWTPTTLAFYKDPLGIVRFRADPHSLSADVLINTTIATLPVGYRPGTTIKCMIIGNRTVVQMGSLGLTTAGVLSTLEGDDGSSKGIVSSRGPYSLFGSYKAEN